MWEMLAGMFGVLCAPSEKLLRSPASLLLSLLGCALGISFLWIYPVFALYHEVISSGSAAQQPGVPESQGKLQAAWFSLESHSMLACICLHLQRK